MLSGIILTHNSAESIQKTLKSLNFCDEIIIIDDNSTDETIQIAQKFNCRILNHGLQNNFAAQRNFGLSKAKGEWCLFIDHDEIVSGELQNEILKAIKTTAFNGYFLKRRDFLFGHEMRYGETANIKLLRLGKKDCGNWDRPVHEVWNINGQIGLLSNPLDHIPHQSIRLFLSEINWYSTINANYLLSQGIKVPGWQIWVYPLAKFIQNYYWKLGFMDGTAGIILAIMMSFHSFLTRAKVYTSKK